jgi:hypothetical protein
MVAEQKDARIVAGRKYARSMVKAGGMSQRCGGSGICNGRIRQIWDCESAFCREHGRHRIAARRWRDRYIEHGK